MTSSMRRLIPLALLAVGLGAATMSPADAGRRLASDTDLAWTPVPVDTDQNFRGLAAVSSARAWISGDAGGVWRTRDGGQTWQDVSPPDAAGLEFRDIEVHGRHRVSALAIGVGEQNQIFRTTDGGRSWTRTFRSDEPSSFYDCMAFYPGGRVGLAVSDPIDGQMRMIRTTDGGATWKILPPEGFPSPVDGEYYFAASGTCLVTSGTQAYLASGGGAARIFHSSDLGRTWSVTDSTLPFSESAGVFGLAFRTPFHGVAVGGDFLNESVGIDYAAATRGGRTWHNTGDLGGYRSGVDWIPGTRGGVLAVGPTGTDLSLDGGRSWATVDTARYDAVQCARDGACWASGRAGTVARWLS